MLSTKSSKQKYMQNALLGKHNKRQAAAAGNQVLITGTTPRMNSPGLQATVKEGPESLPKRLNLSVRNLKLDNRRKKRMTEK